MNKMKYNIKMCTFEIWGFSFSCTLWERIKNENEINILQESYV